MSSLEQGIVGSKKDVQRSFQNQFKGRPNIELNRHSGDLKEQSITEHDKALKLMNFRIGSEPTKKVDGDDTTLHSKGSPTGSSVGERTASKDSKEGSMRLAARPFNAKEKSPVPGTAIDTRKTRFSSDIETRDAIKARNIFSHQDPNRDIGAVMKADQYSDNFLF